MALGMECLLGVLALVVLVGLREETLIYGILMGENILLKASQLVSLVYLSKLQIPQHKLMLYLANLQKMVLWVLGNGIQLLPHHPALIQVLTMRFIPVAGLSMKMSFKQN
jgi:hypothetical protein